ncbi:hypothetical protein AVEN_215597-1 [Araneus ventricosus]|uniref:DUF19 domain-containing protein n=1 Tax=Araneus ventricosus TaxID=182803 RepID=A0A4Y2MNT3_ARAVE|nr:hypothetical protein AVEN_215597-1 [Araneus ventricosus]
MKIILCIASLLNLFVLHGLCNVLQSFDEDDMISCHFHFMCDLNETQKMRQMVEECSDQLQVIIWESMKEVFGLEGLYLPAESFDLYAETFCNQTDEGRMENFCGESFCTTEQYADARLSRVTRNNNDCKKFEDWFICQNPSLVGEYVMSLSTAVVGDEKNKLSSARPNWTF